MTGKNGLPDAHFVYIRHADVSVIAVYQLKMPAAPKKKAEV